MLNEEEIEKAWSLSEKMEKALENLFDKQYYPVLIAALELVQMNLMLKSMNELVYETAKGKEVDRKLLELSVKDAINKTLLGITNTILSTTDYTIILPEELN